MLPRVPELSFNLYLNSIIEFRRGFGLPINPSEGPDTTLHDSLHLEEFVELIEGTNIVETLDALGDLVYVIMGRLVESGVMSHQEALERYPEYTLWIDYIYVAAKTILAKASNSELSVYDVDTFDKVFAAIHASNMTKLCAEAEIIPTKNFYLEQNTETCETLTPVGLWAIQVTVDNSGKNLKTGKVLKNINYKPVNIPAVLVENLITVENTEEIK